MSIPLHIAGSDIGLKNDVKPYLLPDKAMQNLFNAYVFRNRVRKREGLEIIGRLRRSLTNQPAGNISSAGAGNTTYNLINGMGFLITEPNAEIQSGDLQNITITIAAPISTTLTDTTGTGILTPNVLTAISAAYINYSTGVLTLTFTGAFGASATQLTGAYYPGLSSMGIIEREVPTYNNEETIFFDQKYAYKFVGSLGSGQFQEYITGTTWDATDSDFFYGSNWRGATPESRLLFITNFLSTATNQMKYTDGNTWTTFNPAVSATDFLFTAQFLIPYYGRLVALNTYEGLNIGGQVNIYNRARFSQIGSPVEADAWRSDMFGKGGFIDAPVNEAITGVGFIKNTLIVTFEYSTWQLRYIGEYGIPFIWERVSSDFGSTSPFAPVLFNEYLTTVGNRAIFSANSIAADRIDTNIPDLAFSVLNSDNGQLRVAGIRDYQKELVYWSYPNSLSLETGQYFPNVVLIYNYRDNTFSQFDDSVTCFGTFQPQDNITWDSTTVSWDSSTLWLDVENNDRFPYVTSGNQQGYIHLYNYSGADWLGDDQSLSITAIANINSPSNPIRLTIPKHNLQSNDFIYINSMKFIDIGTNPYVSLSTDLNDNIYQVQFVDVDNVDIYFYNGTSYTGIFETTFTPVAINALYTGGGQVTFLPVLYVQTKDFNPFQSKGLQCKLTHIDFLMDSTESAQMTVQVYMNTTQEFQANLPLGNQNLETYLQSPYYVQGSTYAWHRFFANVAGQYFNIVMTYNDELMNDPDTHEQDWILNAFTLYVRPGGKLPF